MDARGAPPMDTSAAKAEMAVISGKQTPTPVSAVSPISGRWPMYMRSTMLYNTLMTCATMAGTASEQKPADAAAAQVGAALGGRDVFLLHGLRVPPCF